MSLETPVGEEDDSFLGDFVEDPTAIAPAMAADRKLLLEDLEEALRELNPREQQVVRLRFGLEDGQIRTLEEVGREFGVTRGEDVQTGDVLLEDGSILGPRQLGLLASRRPRRRSGRGRVRASWSCPPGAELREPGTSLGHDSIYDAQLLHARGRGPRRRRDRLPRRHRLRRPARLPRRALATSWSAPTSWSPAAA